MNRRTFLGLAPAGLAVFTLDRSFAWAQAARTAGVDISGDYAEVSDLYEAARLRALAEGRSM